MKRSGNRQPAEFDFRRLGKSNMHRRLRKGAFFSYVMVYVTVSATLITIAGTCLHAILKADGSERRESLFLRSLQRAEHQLREDSRRFGLTCDSPTSIVSMANDGIRVHWAAERGILSRIEHRQDETSASDRFIFPAGSQIRMEPGPDDSVVIRITEPSVHVTYSRASNGGSIRHKPAAEAVPETPAHVGQPNFAEIRLRGVQR